MGQLYNGAYIAEYQGTKDKKDWKIDFDYNMLYIICDSSLSKAKKDSNGKTRGENHMEH